MPILKPGLASILCAVSLLLLLVGCNPAPPEPEVMAPTATASPTQAPPTSTASAITAPTPTALPTLSLEQVAPFLEIQEMAIACEALHPNRRRTVVQHMTWLAAPDEVPQEFQRLYGQNVQGKLAFGAAYMVAAQWKLDGQPPDSCLIPIGVRLNRLTATMGETPVPEFEME